MRLATFLRRALVLSINVTFRMSVMLAASGFGIYMLFMLLWGRPFGIFFVLALTLFPGLVFLYLSCVRAGLVALKASGPPNMKKLGNATIRLFRFNIMLNNLIFTLVGIGGSVLFMMYMTPDVWAEIEKGFDLTDLDEMKDMFNRLTQMPLAVLLLFTVALSLSVGMIGTSTASVAANAADKGPNHHNLWGVTRQFIPLFTLSMLVLSLPTLLLIRSMGGPLAPFSGFGGQNPIFYICALLYLIWAGCAICGGKALAYVQTVKDMEREWVKEREDMLGDFVPEDNLRSLRRERQEANRTVTSEDQPDDELDDEFDAHIPDQPINAEEFENNDPEPQALKDSSEPEAKGAEIPSAKEDSLPSEDNENTQTIDDFRRAVEQKMAAAIANKTKPAVKAIARVKTKIRTRQTTKAKTRSRAKSKASTKPKPKAKPKAKAKTKT